MRTWVIAIGYLDKIKIEVLITSNSTKLSQKENSIFLQN